MGEPYPIFPETQRLWKRRPIYSRPKKFSSNFNPVAWLFSGWNWVPMTLPLATTAGQLRPVIDGGEDGARIAADGVVAVDEIGVIAAPDAIQQRIRRMDL